MARLLDCQHLEEQRRRGWSPRRTASTPLVHGPASHRWLGDPAARRFAPAILVLGALAAMLAAQPAAAEAVTLTVTPAVAANGDGVTISGSVPSTGDRSCPGQDGVTVTSDAALFQPDGFGPQAARDTDGAFQIRFTVPASTPAGTYQLGLRCGGGNLGVSTTLRVRAAVPGSSTTSTSSPARPTTASPSSTSSSLPETSTTATTTPTTSTAPAVPAAGTADSNAAWWFVAGAATAAVLAGLLAVVARRR